MQGLEENDIAEQALQMLELGRGAILSLLVDDRGDISNSQGNTPIGPL